MLFIHGGPGYHCGAIEYLIEHDNLFESLNCNIVVYDQRMFGRSTNFPEEVTHSDNVRDLTEIEKHLKNVADITLCGFIEHSYGAKLLFDYYKIFGSPLPGVFLATADSTLTPRLNNLMLDLAYLKKSNPIYYQKIFPEFCDFNTEKLWKLTEQLAPYFQENKDRHYLYWADLAAYKKMQEAQEQTALTTNNKIFMMVRKDLYENETNFSVKIDTLNIPYL